MIKKLTVLIIAVGIASCTIGAAMLGGKPCDEHTCERRSGS